MPQDADHAFCRSAFLFYSFFEPAPLSLHSISKARYKCQVIIIIKLDSLEILLTFIMQNFIHEFLFRIVID